MNRAFDLNTLAVNGERLWGSLMDMAKIGATPKGGVKRIALTAEDVAGRDQFVGWCKAQGLAITIDTMGNIFARRPGTEPALPPVMSGSHLDTQPSGGRFDGCYGVMAALEPRDAVVATYREHGHALAHGVPMNAILAEMLGKVEGCCRGRGGSMHLFDRERRFFGGNAIVGGGLPLAAGIAMADRRLRPGAVTACFFGEGAVAEGVPTNDTW